MNGEEKYTIYAVKTKQPWEEDFKYWTPLIYDELKKGKARFGWSYFDDADLNKIEKKIKKDGWKSLNNDEQEAWNHAKFMLLYVKPGDYFIYINMPEYGKCTIVKITGEYDFSEVWDKEKKGDFRHFLPCEFLATFDRNSDIVHPYLRRRLGLQGAWYRIYAKDEFKELLNGITTGAPGKKAKSRFEEELDKYLNKISEELYHTFPAKDLESFLIEVLKNLPNVIDVRKGPDVNGADIEIEFETGLEISGLKKKELCAVQVKSYEGKMGYKKAIEDIERAFDSTPDYTCGLIISTAQEMTEEFEAELNQLREEKGKNVGILLGKDLSRLIVKHGIQNNFE